MGTTIEILQAYPLGTLPVKVEDYEGDTCILWGLSADNTALVRFPNGVNVALSIEDLTPILRDFSSLCTPLEDGTVPAVSLIESFGYVVKEYDEESEEEEVAILTTDGFIAADGYNGQGFELMPDGVLTVWSKAPEQISYETHNAADYLRSKHFALPVNGRPLVEGVDYIRKA